MEQAELQAVADQMDGWVAAYKNASDLSKQLAELDASRAILIDKLTQEEEKARIAEETINAMIADVEESNTETADAIRKLAKEKLGDIVFMDVIG